MQHRTIVVGLDFSAPAAEALRWAALQAKQTESLLRVVHVLRWPSTFGGGAVTPKVGPKPSYDDVDEIYRHSLTAVFDSLSPRPDWLFQFAAGDPGRVLVRQARQAALLVLGSGTTGPGRRPAGRVAHYCLDHAECPVVSVPAARPSELLVGAGAPRASADPGPAAPAL